MWKQLLPLITPNLRRGQNALSQGKDFDVEPHKMCSTIKLKLNTKTYVKKNDRHWSVININTKIFKKKKINVYCRLLFMRLVANFHLGRIIFFPPLWYKSIETEIPKRPKNKRSEAISYNSERIPNNFPWGTLSLSHHVISHRILYINILKWTVTAHKMCRWNIHNSFCFASY